jgi:regulator of sigma E protease
MVGSPVLVSDEQALQEGVRDPYVTVLEISKDSAAEEAGIQLGDKLLSVNGQELVKSTDLREYIVSTENGEAPVSLEVLRAEAQERITVTPRIDEDGNALIGVALARTGTVSHGFFKSMYYGFIDAVLMGWTILSTFGLLVKQLFLGDTSLAGDVAGPVGIATFTGQVARLGFMHLLNFAAVLSMNLAVLNLLPIPALDGGRILFLIIEKIKGSKINQKTENIVHMIGFGLLMVLIVIVTYRDIVGLLG